MNTLENHNIIDGLIVSYSDADTLTNDGTITKAVSLGGGDDRLINDHGTIEGAVDLGVGNDTLSTVAGIIKGNIIGVWYHWLANWSTRAVALRMLRPDLFKDPATKFVVDQSAMREPFRSILTALGIQDDRLVVWDQARDILLRDGIIVSFLNQNYLYPDLMKVLAKDLKTYFLPAIDRTDPVKAPGHVRRIFASRQGFKEARRRVANFDEIKGLLEEFGFDIVQLGEFSAAEQVEMFSAAEFVIGVHGSDLVNVMFCPPTSKLLVIENARNISAGLSVSLDVLGSIFGVEYHALVVDEFIDPDMDYSDFNNIHYRDVIVDPAALRDAMLRMGCYPA